MNIVSVPNSDLAVVLSRF